MTSPSAIDCNNTRCCFVSGRCGNGCFAHCNSFNNTVFDCRYRFITAFPGYIFTCCCQSRCFTNNQCQLGLTQRDFLIHQGGQSIIFFADLNCIPLFLCTRVMDFLQSTTVTECVVTYCGQRNRKRYTCQCPRTLKTAFRNCFDSFTQNRFCKLLAGHECAHSKRCATRNFNTRQSCLGECGLTNRRCLTSKCYFCKSRIPVECIISNRLYRCQISACQAALLERLLANSLDILKVHRSQCAAFRECLLSYTLDTIGLTSQCCGSQTTTSSKRPGPYCLCGFQRNTCQPCAVNKGFIPDLLYLIQVNAGQF